MTTNQNTTETVVTINPVEFQNGVVIINTTPHSIMFQELDGTLKEVPCSTLINATIDEEIVATNDKYSTVKTVFRSSSNGEEVIDAIKTSYPGAIIIGSIIAAQAYPGAVYGMIAVDGYERVAPSEKRFRCDKFITF